MPQGLSKQTIRRQSQIRIFQKHPHGESLMPRALGGALDQRLPLLMNLQRSRPMKGQRILSIKEEVYYKRCRIVKEFKGS